MLRPRLEVVEKSNLYDKFRDALLQLSGGYVKVGFPEGKEPGAQGDPGHKHPKGKQPKPWENMSEVARVAVWNEFGVPGKHGKGIPSRPFFRNAIDGNREALKDFKGKIYDLFLNKKITPHQALEDIGLWMQSKIRESILKGSWKPNTQRTIDKKGSSKPLVDSGQMINSLTFVNSLTKEK